MIKGKWITKASLRRLVPLLCFGLLFACSSGTPADNSQHPEPEPDPPAETGDPADLNAPSERTVDDFFMSLHLEDPDGMTSSTFPRAVTITAQFELFNRGVTADCMKSNTGPAVSFDLYEGDSEVASSLNGIVVGMAMMPVQIEPGLHRYAYVVQALKTPAIEDIGKLSPGDYTVLLRPHLTCETIASGASLGVLAYPFSVVE